MPLFFRRNQPTKGDEYMVNDLAEKHFKGIDEYSPLEDIIKGIRSTLNELCQTSDRILKQPTQTSFCYGHKSLITLCAYVDYFFEEHKVADSKELFPQTIQGISLIGISNMCKHISEWEDKEKRMQLDTALLSFEYIRYLKTLVTSTTKSISS